MVKSLHPSSGIYSTLFTLLADQKEAIESAAFELYLDLLEQGIKPADLQNDAALLYFKLAQAQDNVVEFGSGTSRLHYFDPNEQKLTPEEVKTILMNSDDDDDYDYFPPSG